jgi:hypothetical protein
MAKDKKIKEKKVKVEKEASATVTRGVFTKRGK